MVCVATLSGWLEGRGLPQDPCASPNDSWEYPKRKQAQSEWVGCVSGAPDIAAASDRLLVLFSDYISQGAV